jgi:hypothetical protein
MFIAHGVRSRGDLPLPGWMFVWGAAIALFVSFVALGALWKRPRLASMANGHMFAVSRKTTVSLAWVGRIFMLALFLVTLTSGLFGTNDDDLSIAPVAFYVVAWVGAQVLSGVFGNIWHVVNPVVTIARFVESVRNRLSPNARDQRPAPPGWVGMWPAALGLSVFLFFELAHPSSASPRVIGWVLLVHAGTSVALSARWGVAWLAEHELFGALLNMISSMAPIRLSRDGVTVRLPMAGLTTMPVMTGTAAVLLIVLGGTTFDGFSESEVGRSILGRPSGWGGSVVLTAGMFVSVLAVTLLFAAGTGWIARKTSTPWQQTTVDFIPTLVPIVLGYAIAHYALLLIDETQTFVFRLSDPAGQGWDLFGGADSRANLTLVGPTAIAWIQVVAILAGHVGGIMVAHDRSSERYKGSNVFTSQSVMLVVMVLYSTLGLWLLLTA